MKKNKYQIGGTNPCGQGTVWDDVQKKCVPVQNTKPVDPVFANYGQLNGATTAPQNPYAPPPVINYEGDKLELPNKIVDLSGSRNDGRGRVIPKNLVNNRAIDQGFNLDSDNVYRKAENTVSTEILDFNDKFKALNVALDLTRFISGTVNDAQTNKRERQKYLQSLQEQQSYNQYENGVNNVPAYFQKGGSNKIDNNIYYHPITNPNPAANKIAHKLPFNILNNPAAPGSRRVNGEVVSYPGDTLTNNQIQQAANQISVNGTAGNVNLLPIKKLNDSNIVVAGMAGTNGVTKWYDKENMMDYYKLSPKDRKKIDANLSDRFPRPFNINNQNWLPAPETMKTGGQPKAKNDKELAARILQQGELSGVKLTAAQKKHFKNVVDGRIKMDGHNKNAKKKGTYELGGNPDYVNTTGYTPGTDTYNNPYNIIPSNDITMKNTPFDVMAYPNVGQPTLMKPGGKYKFQGANYVKEVPMFQTGGEPKQEDYPDYESFAAAREIYINSLQSAGDQQTQVAQQTAASVVDPNIYKGDSIVDYLNLEKVNSSKSYRKKLADTLGIKNYNYSAEKNTELLHKLQEQKQNGVDLPNIKASVAETKAAIPTQRKTYKKEAQRKSYEDLDKQLMERAAYWQDQARQQTNAMQAIRNVAANNAIPYSGNQTNVKQSAAFNHKNRGYNDDRVLKQIEQDPNSTVNINARKRKEYFTGLAAGTLAPLALEGVLGAATLRYLPLLESLPEVTATAARAARALTYQEGGQPNVNAELEEGEIFTKQDGSLNKVPDNAGTHEEGGSMQQNVERVLEDTSDKRKDKESKYLKVSADEAEKLTGYKPKSAKSHSKLFEEASKFHENKLKSFEKKIQTNLDYIKYSNGGKLAKNSLDENLKLLETFPTSGHVFDALYDHQEDVKSKYQIDQEAKMQTGGIVPWAGDKYQNKKNASKYSAKEWEDKLKAKGYTGALNNLDIQKFLYATTYGKKIIDDLHTTHPGTIYGDPLQNRYDGKLGYRWDAALDGLPDAVKPAVVAATPAATATTPTEEEQRQYDFSKGNQASKFNEPLEWYNTMPHLMNYLSSLDRIPVDLEQLQYDPLKVHEESYAPQLAQTQGDFNAGLEMLPQNGVGYANQANLLGRKYAVDQQAIAGVESRNKQKYDQVDAVNAQGRMQIEGTNLQLRDQFNTRILQGKEVQRQSKLNAFDDYATMVAQNRKLNREGNLIMELTPYFDQYGKFNGNKFNIVPNSAGGYDIQNKSDSKTVKTISKQQYDAMHQLKGTTETQVKSDK